MSNLNLRNITNHFQDVRLVSLASWRQANEIIPRDRSGPYIVTQEGYDPEDMKFIADEFVLGRSGKWLSLSHFFRKPVDDQALIDAIHWVMGSNRPQPTQSAPLSSP